MTSLRERHPSWQRRIRNNTDEVYSRYLGISLPIASGNKFCEGRFGSFLDKKLGVKKLPYNITLVDLVSSGCITPHLVVELPCSYFESWMNFPCSPRQDSEDEYEGAAGLYSYEAIVSQAKTLKDIVHPYDGALKQGFVEKYKKDFPLENVAYQHPNGRRYKTEELYFSYWQGLALASSIHKINNINLHLPIDEGVEKTKDIIRHAVEGFDERYGDSFERVSWYRTAVSIESSSKINPTYGDVVLELSKYREVDCDILYNDLKNLLCLYKDWSNTVKGSGCAVLRKAIEVLRKDVYFVFEQLCIFGINKGCLFETFSYGRFSCKWAQLKDVLPFEDNAFKDFFTLRLNAYSERVRPLGYECTPRVFEYFSNVEGFYPWVRSLYDLHENIHWDGEVNFAQSRIIDCLIIASVRTEIIIREMLRVSFEGSEGFDANGDLLDIFLAAGHQIEGGEGKILKQAKSESNITKLNSRPADIFLAIDAINYAKWSKENCNFLKSILRFVCVRNYFAHHAYKDEDFDSVESGLASETLKSLVETLLFFYRICHKRNVLASSGEKV